MSFCKLMVSGRLTKDPEVRASQSGKSMMRCSIAWDTYSKSDDKKPNYLDIIAFDRNAENFAKLCKKGTPVALSGDLVMNQWVDKQTGGNRYKHELIVGSFDVNFEKSREQSASSAGTGGASGWDRPAPVKDDGGHPTDDYPF